MILNSIEGGWMGGELVVVTGGKGKGEVEGLEGLNLLVLGSLRSDWLTGLH